MSMWTFQRPGRLVIYQSHGQWEGAVEFWIGRWPFRQVQHAPVTHGATAQIVFDWLVRRYPRRVIALDPAVGERYERE